MTDRELKRLSRVDLLEMMIALSKENEQLRLELVETQQRLADRMIAIEKSGSLADAALHLNGVFEAAENACAQYVENIRVRSERCTQMENETKLKCAQMLAEAKRQAEACLEEAKLKAEQISSDQQAESQSEA